MSNESRSQSRGGDHTEPKASAPETSQWLRIDKNSSFENDSNSTYEERCPNCGRFVEHNADGFYDRLQRDNECSEVRVFCNETCANQFHQKKV